jgi:hypothetical protein
MSRLALWSAPLALTAAAPLAAEQQLPDWSGVWLTEAGSTVSISGFPSGVDNAPEAPPIPLLNPQGPWTAEARAALIGLFGVAATRKSENWGFPVMMVGATPLEFIITPRETLIITAYRDLRHIMTDGRALSGSEDRWVTAWGESVGRWEGDTLVIETVAVRQPGLFLLSPPLSENARYTERLRKVGPDRIEGEMTITDPESLTEPWTIKLAYVRAEGLDRLVYDTFTNDRSEVEGEVFTILPPGEHAAPLSRYARETLTSMNCGAVRAP